MLHGDARLRKNAGERKLARTSDKRQATSDKRGPRRLASNVHRRPLPREKRNHRTSSHRTR
ncbi:hypothetical protein C7S16_6170 [Burkholderia thailandensis]|uniref:Uncharacterized protein n=1 Tax=Burkholderia thailandensis TaxID=57975 RepID=A0AAW9CRI1_BURTH|nr:hypothetical protein [Burkholderia thailandensis]